ncbi:hypothetical protein V9K67_22770 [Paraflavisolibacter sp. H34]|uniref:hypothetical protein n=1 Tax=Huijunlia imazamoxiresistens TaxID=3127457 RepID=UPI00301B5FC6
MIIQLLAQNPLAKKAGVFFLAGCLSLPGLASRTIAQADLSGEWKLNEQKSELGQFGANLAPKSLKVQSVADAVSIERTALTRNGEERTTKERLTFDGKEAETAIYGNSKKKSTAKWSPDGQVLTVNSTILFDRNGETMEIKVTETWKLAEGGLLSVESTSTSSWGTNTMKLVYDKVK